MNSNVDFRNAPFSFYVIRQPVQTYATKAHHVIAAWASQQRSEVDCILSRPSPSNDTIIQGEQQRVIEIEMILDETEYQESQVSQVSQVSPIWWVDAVTWLFN